MPIDIDKALGASLPDSEYSWADEDLPSNGIQLDVRRRTNPVEPFGRIGSLR
jgi:hypothetical protein